MAAIKGLVVVKGGVKGGEGCGDGARELVVREIEDLEMVYVGEGVGDYVEELVGGEEGVEESVIGWFLGNGAREGVGGKVESDEVGEPIAEGERDGAGERVGGEVEGGGGATKLEGRGESADEGTGWEAKGDDAVHLGFPA